MLLLECIPFIPIEIQLDRTHVRLIRCRLCDHKSCQTERVIISVTSITNAQRINTHTHTHALPHQSFWSFLFYRTAKYCILAHSAQILRHNIHECLSSEHVFVIIRRRFVISVRIIRKVERFQQRSGSILSFCSHDEIANCGYILLFSFAFYSFPGAHRKSTACGKIENEEKLV